MLGLDELWWLVSPGNPLKPVEGMAPFSARLASAKKAVRGTPRVRVTGVERRLGTRYTADTIEKLTRLYPHIAFVWLMGADNLLNFHEWERWRDLARRVPIAVLARPRYLGPGLTAPAMSWLRRFRHGHGEALAWPNWRLPAITILPIRLDPTSATAIRAADPRWATAYD